MLVWKHISLSMRKLPVQSRCALPMKKSTYKSYQDSNPWDGKDYGKTCFACAKKVHYKPGGVEYRIERYTFHKRLVDKNNVTTKGSARRIIFCGDCWQSIAGEEYSMEW